MQQSAPEVVEASRRAMMYSGSPKYGDYPGFREWLLTEFALATPTRVIKQSIEDTRVEQLETGSTPWPAMNERKLVLARAELEREWRPMRANLESRIRDIGVVNKNRRLLALQQLAETLGEEMFVERDEKNGRLYLIPEYRQTLRAIAEEVGEIGVHIDDKDTTIRGLVEMLSAAMQISGMGVQANAHASTSNAPTSYDYDRDVIEADFRVTDANLDA